MNRNEQTGRLAGLTPLNLSQLESPSATQRNNNLDSESTLYSQRTAASTPKPPLKPLSHIMDASQTILFTTCMLQKTLNRCLNYTGNDSLHAAFSSTLQKSKSSSEKLVQLLDLIERRPTADVYRQDLVLCTSQCIVILKELCFTLRTRLSTVVQGLDSKFSRNLLMNLYSATVDIKDAWETIQPYLTIDPVTTIATKSFSSPRKQDLNSSSSLVLSPLASPSITDNSQLYTHLRNAVTGSLHVLNTLRQSIDETIKTSISTSLEKKLNELSRQAQNAIDLCHRLDKNVEANMGNNKEDLLLLPTRKEASRRIWEDTSIYLKAIVSVMTFIRSISTEEEFTWPKSVKQGCLYVTRMTAEVAKLWNSSSTFAEDGFYLGRQERSQANTIEQQQCPSPASDIPMQRRNTQQ